MRLFWLDTRMWFGGLPDRMFMWLAWKLPHGLVRWCTVRAVAHASQGRWATEAVSDISAMDVVGRWEKR